MTKIAILGGGITGMMQALSLAHHNIPSSIIERTSSDDFPHDVRTTAFTRRVKTFLESVGIWQLFNKSDIGPIKDIYVVDDKSPRVLHMGYKDADADAMGYIVENDLLKERLYNAVKKNKLITLMKGVDYETNFSSNEFDLILVCEGRASKFRKMFDYRVNKTYGQSAIVLVAEHEVPHEGIAVEHFMKNGPFATLPMNNPNHSSVVWTEKNEVAELYKKMSKTDLNQHLQERFGEFLGKVNIVSDVQVFPLGAMMVKDYFKDNTVLVGDIAHAIHPLAGQGLNQGIKDIESLTNIVAKRLKNGLKIDTIALREYENSRFKDNWAMFLITDNINRFFSNDIKILSGIRKLGLGLLNEMSILKKKIASYGMGKHS
ncbi:MAG: UbiH protein [Pseudomonadota bacterium]|jgi:2-octaprenyl-6-methoxyphenol hydroxylase